MAPELGSRQRWLLVAFLALCVAGLGVAADLTLIHVRVHTDPGYRSFCAISQEVNCDTVAESEYSVFLGLPNSVWGLLGYLVMAVLAIWGLTRKRLVESWPAGLLLLLSTFSVAVSLVLAVISKLVIRSWCLMCIASWAVALGLLVVSLLLARREGWRSAVRADLWALLSRPALFLGLAAPAAVALGALWLALPRYWVPAESAGPGELATGT
ncbi:MAG: vitamin K epoxide reductase, partial [Deltaproteobacteria bacterium]|nr:vitamin K epoxide reductase [Deltaproteobacteria bacterium]